GVNFQDLGSVSWAVPAINRLATMGIINGRSETVFDPNATVTRAEFAKMVCIAFGISTNTGNMQTFADVTLSDWFYPYVEAAAAAGVINGISDTEFAPNDLITREQMAAMMYRAITYKNVTIQTGAIRDFSDAWNISEYAVNAVNTLSAAGVINGMEDGTFAPKATATRAQAACIIYQYFQSIGL
ncbi:MAG: S-layer homology domain-containing protein, partial [Oscillospiraceae bacterium]|nr:S-layer homology domain-containing protein [Oscillospiraceae bacterium]